MHLREWSDKRVLKLPFYSVLTVSQILTRDGIYVIHFSRPFSNGYCYRQTVEEYAKKKYSRRFAHFSLFSHACPFERPLYTCQACIHPARDDDTSNAAENEYARECDLSLQMAERNRSLKMFLWSRLSWQTTFANAILV